MWQSGWELELQKLRTGIDEIDKQIIVNTAQRTQLCERIAKIKAEYGLPIYVPWREQEVLEKRLKWGQEYNLRPQFIRELFELIMSESKRQQKELIETKIC